MIGKERRSKIIDILRNSNEPITGSELAKVFNVSRQIIVGDIALIRAEGERIISTSNGYMMYSFNNNTSKRVFALNHHKDQIEDELTTIVDLGGTVLNVIITHPIYGEITTDLMISSRKGIKGFLKKIRENNFVPLMHLTGGVHYHTVEGGSEKALDDIENKLREKGYLINLK